MVLAEPRPAGFWHAALLHHGAAEFETTTCEFAKTAARVGAAVLIACPARSLGRLRVRLDGLSDRVTWADMADIGPNPGRLIHEISRFASQHPGRDICLVQQATWPTRPDEELWEVFRHEALLNIALAGVPVRVLCPYDTSLPRRMISCAEATHPVITSGEGWQPSSRYQHARSRPVPDECDQPLPPVPHGARVAEFTDDLAAVRHLVSLHALAAGLSRARTDDLLIAVGELAANTLVHGGGRGTLALWATVGEVTCEVRDAGHITDPLVGRLRPGPAAAGGGRGLWLVHQLCDLVQVRTGPAGTTIRVHMHLAPGHGS
jgi:anti-sigma regulatory factor (Ser/Thr protein kinase)